MADKFFSWRTIFFLADKLGRFAKGRTEKLPGGPKFACHVVRRAVIIGCYKLSVNSTMSALHQASGLGKSSPDVANY